MKRFLIIAVALVMAGPVLAGEQPASDLAKKVAPLLEPQAFAVAHIQLDQVNPAGLVKLATQIAALDPGEAAIMAMAAKLSLNTLTAAGAKEMFAVSSLEGFPLDPGFAAIPIADEEAGKKLAAAVKPFLPPNKVHLVKGFVILGSKESAKRLADLKPSAPPHLDKALSVFPKADIRLVVVLPETLRRSLGELIPELPAELGGGKTVPLLKGFHYFAAGITLAPNFSVEGVLRTGDAKSATAFQSVLVDGMTWFKNMAKMELPDPNFLPHLEKALALLTPKKEGNGLTWNLAEQDIKPIVVPLVAEIRKAASKAQDANNLKQIGLAIHNYHSAHNHFPTGIYDKNGKALLSWRVQILPYVEGTPLYQGFKLDEPWDSAHNLPLSKKMPPVFHSPTSKAPAGKTVYLGPFGKGLIFSGPKPLKIQDIKDGTSNTIMVLEVDDDHAAVWTKPEGLVIDPQQPLKGVGNNPSGKFHALFADGAVRVITSKIAPADFYGMLTIAGGEPPPKLPE